MNFIFLRKKVFILMHIDDDLLLNCALFQGIAKQDFPHLLHCLKAHVKTYQAGEYVFSLGDKVNYVGVVLSGRLEIVKENLAGNRTIIAFLTPSHLFGEGIVCTSKRLSPVSVHVQSEASVLLIPYTYIIKSCGNACLFHTQLISNMLRILGDKNYILNTKIDLLTLKGIQEKLITYLLNEAGKNNSLSFNITPNRTELAEFLNVSRTSMCRELSNLKKENLIDYYKNSFKLIDKKGLQDKLSS